METTYRPLYRSPVATGLPRFSLGRPSITGSLRAGLLAQALGVELRFGPELLEAGLAVATAIPDGRARLAPGASFAPAVAWTGGSRLDEIVAILGRSPRWPE
ncbi:hypothetical protein [Nonomuraea sp. NPDC050783]|uniref:hypothetical protein n=1 Tax=Nonomuraea sp. NPDC050783 TaxID=3154634 RepID=UPI003466A4F0